ncbi:DoxX family protein [Leptospira sp. 'Mane']|uniref:DoxX family protein n=1 Tax=Leptospira sp. 'Mane' TaxID=3387407 RepID=UPI00398A7C75
MNLLYRLLATKKDITLTIIRVTLGIVMLPHGAQKLFGSFGGYGFEGTMGFMTGQLGIPSLFAFLAIIAESFGALGLILGLFTRVAAFGVFATMLVAAALVHLPNGFFAPTGIEYFILTFGLAIPLIIKGAGSFSLDDLVSSKLEK